VEARRKGELEKKKGIYKNTARSRLPWRRKKGGYSKTLEKRNVDVTSVAGIGYKEKKRKITLSKAVREQAKARIAESKGRRRPEPAVGATMPKPKKKTRAGAKWKKEMWGRCSSTGWGQGGLRENFGMAPTKCELWWRSD